MRRKSPLPLLFLALAVAGALVVWRFWPAERQEPETVPEPAETASVTLYFANRAYMETGDESLPRLVAEERIVNLEGTDPAEAAVRALQDGPESPEGARVIAENIHILSVRQEGNLARVDLDREKLAGGSMEESFLVQGVVKTLTALPGIEKVQFLVDGESVESLMGHLSVSEPLTEEDVDPQSRK